MLVSSLIFLVKFPYHIRNSTWRYAEPLGYLWSFNPFGCPEASNVLLVQPNDLCPVGVREPVVISFRFHWFASCITPNVPCIVLKLTSLNPLDFISGWYPQQW